MRRRAILGVLRNFVESISSRNSDLDGYWVFGHLVSGLDGIDIDLLAPDAMSDSMRPRPSDSLAQFTEFTRHVFRQQLAKAGVALPVVRGAALRMERSSDVVSRPDGSDERRVYRVVLKASAQIGADGAVTCERVIFVAPHDPSLELRSTRWGGKQH